MTRLPPKVIELFVPASWRASVSRAVRDFVPEYAIAYLKNVSGEDMFDDTLDYLEEAYGAAGVSYSTVTRSQLTDAVLRHFDYFRSYHGCRPLAIDSYFSCDCLDSVDRDATVT